LDQAKIFYELFNFTPGELLTNIVERGAIFTQLDYINVLQLLNRSQPRPDNETLAKNVEKLSEILNGAGARPGVQV